MHKSLYKNLFIDYKFLSLPLFILNQKKPKSITRKSSLRNVKGLVLNIHNGKLYRQRRLSNIYFGKIGSLCLTRKK